MEGGDAVTKQWQLPGASLKARLGRLKIIKKRKGLGNERKER